MFSHLRHLRQCCRYAPVFTRSSLLLRSERMIKFTTPKVYLYRGVGNKMSKEFEDKWIAYDGIPPGYEIIYKGKLDKYITAMIVLNVLLYSLAFTILGYRYFILKEPLYDLGEYYGTKQFALATSDVEVVALAVMYIILGYCCYVLANRTVLRIYNSGEKYVAVFTRYNPMKKNHMYFTVDECLPVKGKIIPRILQGSGFAFKNKKVFLMEDNFRTARDQIKLTGESGDFEDSY